MDLVDLLNKRGIPFKKTNNPSEILVKCTGGTHDDKNPSLSFNLDSNVFNCWSCGFKGGIYKFLESIGEAPTLDISSKQPYRIKKLKTKIQSKLLNNELTLPDDRRLFLEEYREITAETFKEFRAFTSNERGLRDYLCIPVYQYNQLKFIEARLMKPLENQPKYLRMPEKSVVSDCLFPLDKIKNTNYIILVEGIFDMLNLWDLGYKNTLCIFGTTNFNKTKLDILDNLGINRVDIMMDGDSAGAKAADKIYELLDSRNIYSRIINIPEGLDPGVLTDKQLKGLLK